MDRRQNENFFNRHPSSPTPQKQARGKSLKNNLKLANMACQLYCNLKRSKNVTNGWAFHKQYWGSLVYKLI